MNQLFNRIKQYTHLLQENQLLHQEQIKKQYELSNLTRKETAKKRKFLKKLGNYATVLQLRGKIAVL